jgi:hypothetical protein
MDGPVADAAALRALAAKYRTLLALRARRDADQPQAGRDELRALAARHPGCLRELDTLGAVELSRRAEAAEAAAGGGARAEWMDWIWSYHQLMRAALDTKRALAGPRADPDRLAAEATRVSGLSLGGDFVRAVAAPPQGRLAVLVLRRLGHLFATPAEAIAARLFPTRRPSPYTLDDIEENDEKDEKDEIDP